MPPRKLKYGRPEKGKSKAFAVFLSFCLLAVVCLALGVAYISLAKEISPFFLSLSSRSWSQTGGKVDKTFTSTKPVPAGGRSARSGVRYVPNVVYSYRVADREFRGERINFAADLSFASAEESDNFLNSYRDKTVEVFYNPNDPQQSALSREYHYRFGDYQAGCCCGSIGIFFTLLFWLSVRDLIKTFRK